MPGASGALASSSAQIIDRIIANVNGEIILMSELRREQAQIKQLQQQKTINIPLEEMKAENILQRIINEKVVLHYARESNLTVSEKEVDKEVESFKSSNRLTDETLLAGLKEQKVSLEKFRANLRSQILLKRITGMEVGQVNVTDDDIRRYYESRRSEYMKPGRVKASHIILLVPDRSDRVKLAVTKARIESLLTQIRNGTDFAKLATAYSQDGAAQNGGELGWFGKGDMLPIFENAAFALEPGEVGGPILSQYGYHLIKVTGKEKPSLVPFEKVEEQIRRIVTDKAYMKKRTTWIERLRDQAYIEVLY